MGILISTSELAEQLASRTSPRLLDVRWTLGGGNGYADFLDGHIAGAVFADLDVDLASSPGEGQGRHPLPSVADIQQSIRRWGINEDDEVVVYDHADGMTAARAWWVLRWAGAKDVRILDGGYAAWEKADLQTAVGPGVDPRPGTFTVTPHSLPHIDIDEVSPWLSEGVLIDARAPERYRGEKEPIDRIAGHIPGAISMPTTGNLTEDGYFLPPEQIRQRYAGAGITDASQVVCYCGSGVHAAHTIAALEHAGLPGAVLYPGGWSQWSGQRRPVATGTEPGSLHH